MEHILRYREEAKDWNEALPIGNGFLGAMIFGNPFDNHFQLNEDSIWYGGPMDRNNPDALKNLPKLRNFLLNGQTKEAEELLSVAFAGVPSSPRMYQTAGDLYLVNENLLSYNNKSTLPPFYNYERYLDIDNGVSGYEYRADDTKYKVTAFASNPCNVIVIRYEAEGREKINLKIHLERGRFFDECGKYDSSSIFLSGKLGSDDLTFHEIVKAESDGNVFTEGEYLFIRKATEVTLYISIATSFRYYYPDNGTSDLICDAVNKGYVYIYEEHLKDYKNLYDRSSLSLGTDNGKFTKDITSAPRDNMKEMTELLFAYGKYLLISSSREKSLPANLQGIWNKDMTPPWDSKFTININTEMNYWPAEMCNLSECHLPLFDLMKRMEEKGSVTAKKMYGCKGWVAHHNTDIWGDTAPVDVWIPGTFWVMGAAWLCTHIWKHYEYTEDKSFLGENFYLMRECVEFFSDFLIEKDGYLVTAPSVSPENTFILENGSKGCNGIGCTMDNQILRDLFNDSIKACEVLETEYSFKRKTEKMLSKLMPTRIGSKGQILEWEKEYKEAEPGHRHMSHLYGLHPSNQITPDKTKELAEAAKISLEMRLKEGGGHTGWSRAWIINHYAKLWDKDKTYENLVLFCENSLLPNLFDNHPPFQIDGNFGVCSGICEMFVQSDEDRIVLLPALPDEFKSGEMKGVKCVGNITVDITWELGKLTGLNLLSPKKMTVNVLYNDDTYCYDLQENELFSVSFK